MKAQACAMVLAVWGFMHILVFICVFFFLLLFQLGNGRFFLWEFYFGKNLRDFTTGISFKDNFAAIHTLLILF